MSRAPNGPLAACAAIAVLGLAGVLRAQTPQGSIVPPPAARDLRATRTGTAAIAGVVVAADTGRPVRRVHVTLLSTAPDVTLSVTMADDGHFKFNDLPAGAFILTASRPGFVDSAFGQRQPGSGRPGSPVQLADGQKRTLTVVATTTTDDRGIYRATGLLPGDYIVSATTVDAPTVDQVAADAKKRFAEASVTGNDAASMLAELKATIARLGDSSDPSKDTPTGYAPVYYPGTTLAAAAQTLTLGVSEERQAVDVSLQLVPMTRVSGVVTGAVGTAASVQVVLTSTGTPVPLPGPRATRCGQDGRFSFAAVSPGSYEVMAFTMQDSAVVAKMAADMLATTSTKSPAGPDVPSAWAAADVVVDGGPFAPLVLGLQPALAVSGRVALSGSSPPPDLSRARVLASAASSTSPERSAPVPTATVDPAGRFNLTGLVPGRYHLSVAGAGAPWSIASAVVGGRDVMDVPLEMRPGDDLGGLVMTLTDRTTSLSGTLQDAGGRVTSDFTVVVFPADRAYWLPQARRIQATRPSTDGRYRFRGLPPGDYLLAVVPDVEPGQWYDPAWLRQVQAVAVSMTLTGGAHITQDMRVGK